ncbi:MAG: hypothetical protein KA765_16760 [Thermoflexales bacterium]|nr:hypothetical protein [Thermoflexales bacterium]
MTIHDLLNKLADDERRFSGTQFLAPIVGRGPVLIRIAGIICRLRVTENLPHNFTGWAILQARAISAATFIRSATLSEVSTYLRLFPPIRLILAAFTDRTWLALPAQRGDTAVPVFLAEDGLERFETIIARFDGRVFWYERRDPSRDPALAAYLREQFALSTQPADLHKANLSREEREAYAFAQALIAQAEQDRVSGRLKHALDHAGAKYRSHIEREGVYVITYEVDSHTHTSTIRRDDLSVETAGICLAGQDRRFDLTSLVGVLREARDTGRIVPVGDDAWLDEERYWQVQPPERDE